ncbi:MAG: hypothetical protein SVY41_01945 [Candidatus Nanohaloarchaea archaeon]|nr:hypothetical protein [Candidatus Nanohaloarchaea archaeon]
MIKSRLYSAAVKGGIGGSIAVIITFLFHNVAIPASGITWALIAVGVGAFFSGFFAEYTDKVCCGGETSATDQYLAVGSVLFVLGITDTVASTVTSALFLISSGFFFLAAYRESDADLTEIFE